MLPPLFVHLIYSGCLAFWLNETKQMNHINQIDLACPNRAGYQDPAVPNWFFRSLLLVDISKRCAVCERRLEARG